MNTAPDPSDFDLQVRRLVYHELIERGAMPSAMQLASRLGRSMTEVRASLRRLKEAHVLVLQEADQEILMANPFSAVPTPFLVKISDKSWWGNCI